MQLGPYFHLGSLLTNGKLYHYNAGLSTEKTVWLDRNKITTGTQPLTSDANGVFSFFGEGLYKMILTDVNGAIVSQWDQWAIGGLYPTAFTPTLTFGGAASGMTGTLSGTYATMGNLCFVSILITLTAKGASTGSALIGALPLTSASSTNNGHLSVTYTNMSGIAVPLIGKIGASGTTVALVDGGATDFAAVDDTNFTDTSSLQLSGWYVVA